VDERDRRFDPIDEFYKFKGNLECNKQLQPGFEDGLRHVRTRGRPDRAARPWPRRPPRHHARGAWTPADSADLPRLHPDRRRRVRPGTRRVYSSYWNRIDKHWGERRIDEPTPSDIRQFLVDMQSELVMRRSGRGGHSAAEHMIAALPCLYRRAEEDGLITAAAKPRQ
jgi:hypothetical protein